MPSKRRSAPHTPPADPPWLSALIRQGATRRPQCFYDYFSASGGSCALGAAMEARTGSTNVRRGLEALGAELPALFSTDNLLTCPLDRHQVDGRLRRFLGLSGLIAHLNNEHGLARERIADWLDSLGL